MEGREPVKSASMACPVQDGVSPTEPEDALMPVNLASGTIVALVGVVAIAVPVSTLDAPSVIIAPNRCQLAN